QSPKSKVALSCLWTLDFGYDMLPCRQLRTTALQCRHIAHEETTIVCTCAHIYEYEAQPPAETTLDFGLWTLDCPCYPRVGRGLRAGRGPPAGPGYPEGRPGHAERRFLPLRVRGVKAPETATGLICERGRRGRCQARQAGSRYSGDLRRGAAEDQGAGKRQQ